MEYSNVTTESAPQQVLDRIIKELFFGKPERCEVLSHRSRLTGKVREEGKLIAQVTHPSRLIGHEHRRETILHFVHCVLDILHPPVRKENGKHVHTDFWHQDATRVGQLSLREYPTKAEHFDVVPDSLLDRLMPDLMDMLDDGRTYTANSREKPINIYRECTICGYSKAVRNRDEEKFWQIMDACPDCTRKFHVALVNNLPEYIEDGENLVLF